MAHGPVILESVHRLGKVPGQVLYRRRAVIIDAQSRPARSLPDE
jgi:hypothetical protein